jgi:acyl-[acyl-carrier-protein]-phospholipid O-acyltransferase / long-chain-fatty-acid--[acyl-carrier-protein] ligase
MSWAFLHPVSPVFLLLRLFLRLSGRVRVRGLEHLRAAGPRALIVANHVSAFDAVLLSAFLPGRILFAMPPSAAGRWWLQPYWLARRTLDQNNPKTAKLMVDAIKRGTRCLVFPEGRVGRTGGLMKIYESPGMIADKADATIVPVRIDGPQYSIFSEQRGLVRRRLFPHVTLTVMPAKKIGLPASVKGHKRRQLAGSKLHDWMETALIEGMEISTMLRQLLASRHLRGGNGIILEDAARKPLCHNAFVGRVFALARALRSRIGGGTTAGIMLPNGIACGTAIFALQALDRVAAMINYSAGPVRSVQACKMAKIETVITSRGFVAALHFEPIVEAMEREGIRVLHLEDIRAGALDRLCGFVRALLPAGLASHGLPRDPAAPALMLFTSGTEGMPKGVMLSHRNIIANAFQFGLRIGYGIGDSIFACLPMFHSFGLTLGFFLPVFSGTRTFLYPSPLRYHDIPEHVYDVGATLLLGTDTFLANYARMASPHDFYFLRFAIGGAERIKPETRRVWAEKFGVRLFEGYGTTEASPVISCNSPLHYMAGTVGRPLSGMEIKLKPLDGIANGGELIVRGLNLMLGYVKAEAPGVVQPPEDGWYNTGDVVSVDEDGYITILGRTKRFAKIGGEMVPLGAIEAVVSAEWPEARHVAIGIQQGRKGETIVLLTESDQADLGLLHRLFEAAGLTKLSWPRKLIKVAQVPLLGSGKTDYVAAQELAKAAEANAAEEPPAN